MTRVVDLRSPKPAPRRASRREPPREHKRAPLRVRKRRRRAVAAVVLIGLVAVGVFALRWVSFFPEYSIQEIRVEGVSTLPEADVRAAADEFFTRSRSFLSPRFIFTYAHEVLEASLRERFLRIAEVHVSRTELLSTTLAITVVERAPYARWCASAAMCYLLDDHGFIFAADASSTMPVSEPIVFVGGVSTTSAFLGQHVAPGRFPSLLSIARALGQAGYAPERVAIDDENDLSIVLPRGIVLYATAGADAQSLARDLRLVLSSDALKDHLADVQYVDLRFGNRVFYKLKGKEVVGE